MPILTEIQEASEAMNCYALLDYLINERFPGKVVVTGSLRARSIVVQEIVSEISKDVPIVFCHAGTLFDESKEYKKQIFEKFRFNDVREPLMGEMDVMSGDHDHVEWMQANYKGSQTCIQEALHLNKTMQEFDCWISAVYHVPSKKGVRNRVDIEGKLIRINPILDWDNETVNEFMEVHDIPVHKLAKHEAPHHVGEGTAPSYAF